MSGYFEKFSQEYQTLGMMLTFDEAGRERGFTEADRRAMAEGLDTIRTAMVQPVGTAAASRVQGAVSDAEFCHAVMRVVLAAMRLWLSGKLETMEVDHER